MSYQNKILGLLLVGIFPYLILFFFCHPSGDDFTYAVLGTKQNILSALMDEYNLWNGRYSSNFFVLKNPLIFRQNWLRFYRFFLAGYFCLIFLSYHYFFSYFLGVVRSLKLVVLISLLFTLLFIFQMPILSEGIYWYTGVVTYPLSNCLVLLYLVNLHRFSVFENGYKKASVFLLLFVSILFIAGFNEVIMLLFLMFHLLLYYIQVKRNLRNKTWFFGLLVASIIAFSFVYFAPGNKIRESYFIGKSHRLSYSLLQTSLQILRFTFQWLSNGVLILLSLVYLYFLPYLEKHIHLIRQQFYLNKLQSVGLLVGVLFFAIFPAYWGTGIMGQQRTVNTAYFYFIILWFVNLTVWKKTSFIATINISSKSYRYFLGISIIVMLVTNNSYDAWKNIITLEASNFSSELNKRYLILNKTDANTKKVIRIPSLKSAPISIYTYDISKDPNYFPNTSYRSYWKLHGYIVSK